MVVGVGGGGWINGVFCTKRVEEMFPFYNRSNVLVTDSFFQTPPCVLASCFQLIPLWRKLCRRFAGVKNFPYFV